MSAVKLTEAQRKAAIESIVEKLDEVDALIQSTFGASDFCYEMHTAVQNIVDEVTFSQERA